MERYQMSKILPTLYIGSERDSLDKTQMKNNKITHVVRVSIAPEKMEKASLDPQPQCFYVTAWDRENYNLIQHVSAVNEFVHKSRMDGGTVLVHCQAGVSRSVGLVIAYLMSTTKYGYDDVFRVIENARDYANPNKGFVTQLQNFEHEGLKKERDRIREKFGHESDEFRNGDNAEMQKQLAEIQRKKSGRNGKK